MVVKCVGGFWLHNFLAMMSRLLCSLLFLFSCQPSQAFVSTHFSVRREAVGNANFVVDGWNPAVRRMPTQQFLFNLPNLQGRSGISSGNGRKWVITKESMEEISQKGLSFPYQIKLENVQKENSSSKNQIMQTEDQSQSSFQTASTETSKNGEVTKTERANKIVVVRHLEDEDLPAALRLIVQEYGSYGSSDNEQSESNSMMKNIEPFLNYYENYMFSWIVGLGLLQRIKRRKEGDSANPTTKEFNSSPPDHNVLCIAELDENGVENRIVGTAEISLQPPDPERSSPPYVLPMFVKNLLAKFFAKDSAPCAYVSNVLIANEYRGLGYSKILMYACEGLATTWGYDSVYLHVDAAVTSGKEAQNLYRGLGYEPVVQSSYDSKLSWMGPDMMNLGVYIVEGVPLIFLRKELVQ